MHWLHIFIDIGAAVATALSVGLVGRGKKTQAAGTIAGTLITEIKKETK